MCGYFINGSTKTKGVLKDLFHSECMELLKFIAYEMGLKTSDYDLRSNKGGIAVCGEITLHTDSLYVQISQSSMQGLDILYRSCDGRKDYTGGQKPLVFFR